MEGQPVRSWAPTRRRDLQVLLQLSGLALFFSLVPLAAYSGVENAGFWRWALAAYGLVHATDVSTFLFRQPEGPRRPIWLGLVFAVVGRDGAGGASGVVDEVNGSTVGGLDGTGLELTDHDAPAFAIDEREDAVLVGDVADHGIGFEVTDTATVLCTSGAFRYGALAGEATSGIVGTVPLSALFGRTAQVLVKASTPLSIAPDMAVDGLVDDQKLPPTP